MSKVGIVDQRNDTNASAHTVRSALLQSVMMPRSDQKPEYRNHQPSHAHLRSWKRIEHVRRISTRDGKHISSNLVFVSLGLCANLAQQ